MKLDSGFHRLDSGFQGLDSGFQSPGFRIPKAKKCWIPDSGFPYMGRDRLSRKSPKRPPEARKSHKNTANTQQVRFFKLYFDFSVFSVENRRLFSIEFQLHTNSHITLWLPVPKHAGWPLFFIASLKFSKHNYQVLKFLNLKYLLSSRSVLIG